MKTSMRMTLDGLMRALRWQMHDLAEEIEQRYRRGNWMPRAESGSGGERVHERGEGDDRLGH